MGTVAGSQKRAVTADRSTDQGYSQSRACQRLNRTPRHSTGVLTRSPPSAALKLHRKLWQHLVPQENKPKSTPTPGHMGEQPLFSS